MSSFGPLAPLCFLPAIPRLVAAEPGVRYKAESSSGALRFPHVQSASLPQNTRNTI